MISLPRLQVVNVRSDLFPYYRKLGYVKTGEAPYPYPDRLSRPVHFEVYTKTLMIDTIVIQQ